MFHTLISTQNLAEHLSNPAWLIVDCRFDLVNPSWGRTAYLEAHIPGAVYAHLANDLSAPITPETGRHPLPSSEIAARQLARLGVSDETQVVAYDHLGGAYAARLWWMLKWLGLKAAAVLDGGIQAWQSDGRPLHTGEETAFAVNLTPRIQPGWTVSTQQVEKLRLQSNWLLVDARSNSRFHGEEEPIDTVAGHIPGSVNRFHGENLSPDGKFLPADTLRAQFIGLLNRVTPDHSVMYCGSGVTSCHHILAMEMAGLSGAKLYPGSWSEWIRDPNRPRSK